MNGDSHVELTDSDYLAAWQALREANEPKPCSLCGEWGFHPVFADWSVDQYGGDDAVRKDFGQFHRAPHINKLLELRQREN